MLNALHTGKKVMGVKQTRRAVRDGVAVRVFLARDADPALTDPVKTQCLAVGIPLCEQFTMRELGRAAGIQVGAAVAALVR